VTPRRCTTQRDSMVHAKTWPAWETLCGVPGVRQLSADNTDPVTCTRCIAALTRLGDAIVACLAGRSG